jgi:hypothetical protein
MGTCGMIFFSFWSWNSGVEGRSNARNKNGDDMVSMSAGQLLVILPGAFISLPRPGSKTGLEYSLCVMTFCVSICTLP